MRRMLSVSLLLCACAGCVEQELSVRSDPPGALVYLNDQEAGRTPFSHRFLWYGVYDVQVRKEGYQTLKTASPVIAPWWQWVPFDLVAEVMPFHFKDEQVLNYHLEPVSVQQVDPEAMVERGQQLRERLESSRLPAPATTRPKSAPATRPSRGK